MDFNTLSTTQSNLSKEIKKVIEDFKNLRSQNRKDANYFKRIKASLEPLKKQFDDNHTSIINLDDKDDNDLYFTSNFYDKWSEQMSEFTKRLDELINEGGNDSGATAITTSGSTSTGAIAKTQSKPTRENMFQIPPKFEYSINQDNAEHEKNSEVQALINAQKLRFACLTPHLSSIQLKLNQRQPSSYYDLKIDLINEYWHAIKEAQQELFKFSNEAKNLGYDYEFYSSLDVQVQSILEKLSENRDQVQTSTTQLNQNTTSHNTNHQAQFKLPQISLPEFNGDYTKWPQFRDLFLKFVGNQPLSNPEKMFFLLGNVKGEAKSLLSHLSATEHDYPIAWKILTDRYENNRILASNLFDKLFNQPSTQGDSTTSIRHMHDVTKECMLGLSNLQIESTSSDKIIMHHLLKKLDQTTKHLFEQKHSSPKEFPTTTELLEFLELRFQTLETSNKSNRNPIQGAFKRPQNKQFSFIASASNTANCIACSKDHKLFACARFLGWEPKERLNFLHRNRLCINCMKPGHNISKCESRRCSYCSSKHNSLVHFDQRPSMSNEGNNSHKSQRRPELQQKSKQSTGQSSNIGQSGTNTVLSTLRDQESTTPVQVVLSTAIISVINSKGEPVDCRAILDCGSQVHLITKRLQEKLGLKSTNSSSEVEGVGENKQKIDKQVIATIKSKVSGYCIKIKASVLPKITSHQPAYNIDVNKWKIPDSIKLADPKFNSPQRIDMLIGMELFYELLCIGQINLGERLPKLQNTVFGWVVGGIYPIATNQSSICGIVTQEELDLERKVERFWRMEEIAAPTKKLTSEEKFCEEYFQKTTKRRDDGRIIVKLPFKMDPSVLGESRATAVRRLLSVERKFERHPEVKELYVKFMKDYEELGHMKKVNHHTIQKPLCYLAHHAVLRADSASTPSRTVFDGSSVTSTNYSLNDCCSVGALSQDELFTILLRFCLPKYVFTADIKKMFRQIIVAEEDRKFQLILWREKPTDPIDTYELCTVTYGTNSAPYIATRCLQYISDNNSTTHPLGAKVIGKDFYMDDCMTGSNDLKTASQMQTETIQLLEAHGFKLHKWCSNHKNLLKNIDPAERAIQLEMFDDKENFVSTLGLIWQPQSDEFRLKVKPCGHIKVTKRIVLSDISQLFDPLGFVNPVIVIAKMFLQRLWKLKLDWDEAVPQEMHSYWVMFREKLPTLASVKIPRHAFFNKIPKEIQIHGFSDASEKAYGAVIYLRATYPDNSSTVHISCSKSRIVPMNKPQTLPKLELSAAKLLADLVHRVRNDISVSQKNCFYWSDSEIVLAWINSEPALYQTFVANRIGVIQELTNVTHWRHVSSKENPADIVSRGMLPAELASSSLWFKGPDFLHKSPTRWPAPYKKHETDVEKKRMKVHLVEAADKT